MTVKVSAIRTPKSTGAVIADDAFRSIRDARPPQANLRLPPPFLHVVPDRMPESKPEKMETTIGYFTVVNDQRTGWTGGLLVLDRGGRPLEFQCTLPVRPSRAHEILFGSTLAAHLVSHVIGKLLVAKCRTPLTLLCCDLTEALEIESFTSSPVALIREAIETDDRPIPTDMLKGSESVEVAGASFIVPIERRDEVERLAECYIDLPDAVEPFERIREAIKEAHSQLARPSSEAA